MECSQMQSTRLWTYAKRATLIDMSPDVGQTGHTPIDTSLDVGQTGHPHRHVSGRRPNGPPSSTRLRT
ncbi:unnamed protein product [Prunus armeniaca]|uniref:Uncharacterized protein n=1 Tax=Prunus armeniaca TaxID=36596 RepID=A0A6J5UT12_PRUAR|nr:unnamed protein product [Prunus armeniaca]CAB4310190.1 unnamed protein product [Prunus armeniaca]